MRAGAPVDPNLSLADLLPPDKSDSSGILQAGYALVEALARRAPTAGPLEVTVTLGPAAWAALEAETRRPYRGRAAYKYTPHPGGAGAARWVRQGAAEHCEGCSEPNCDAGRRQIRSADVVLTVPAYSATITGIDP